MNKFLEVLSVLIMFVSILPILDSKKWWVRNWDFPRLQILVISLILLLLNLFYKESLILLVLLFINCIVQISKIYPYTKIAKKSVGNGQKLKTSFSFITANIEYINKKYHLITELILKKSPDIILLLETNHKWLEELAAIIKIYPYQVLQPQENAYGMILLSKFKLSQSSVEFLVKDDIPSIHTKVSLPCGRDIKLCCVHPIPPIPPTLSEDSSHSHQRDAELERVGKIVASEQLPIIVAGDLNDVAWSKTTKEFQKSSKLLDPRRGRGLYNSFHAKYFYIRFPLDHVFISKEFSCNDLQRLNNVGSDHFPIYINLELTRK